MRRRRYIFVSPRVLPRSGLLPGVWSCMIYVPGTGSLYVCQKFESVGTRYIASAHAMRNYLKMYMLTLTRCIASLQVNILL